MASEKLTTGRQLRAARVLLGWTRAALARAAMLHPNSVAYWEAQESIRAASQIVGCQKLLGALKRGGCELLSSPAPGVRLCAPEPILASPGGRARASWTLTNGGVRTKSQNIEKRPCGAKTRKGAPCRRQGLANGRCRNHGGCSTGPRTAEGREAIANCQRQRWEARRSAAKGR